MDAISSAEQRFEQWRRRVGLVLALLLGFSLWVAPLPLPAPAHTLAAIFAFTVVLWMTEAVPLAVASLLGTLLLVVGGVAPMEKAFAAYAHPVTFLFLGGFLLAAAMHKHGLDRRLALGLMAMPGVAVSPLRLAVALGVLTAALSMWMSNTAITALMVPIVLGILKTCPALARHRGSAAALVLTVAFSASIGGLATPVGTPTNLVALGHLEKLTGERPDFLMWMKIGLPLCAVLLAGLFFIVRPGGALGDHERVLLEEQFAREKAALGRLRLGEMGTLLAFLCALVLWLHPGITEAMGGSAAWMKKAFPEEGIALGAGLLLFLLPAGRGDRVLEWVDAAKIDWGTLLLFGGGFALGQQMKETGLADAIGQGVVGALGQPGEGMLLAVSIFVSIALSEATSNVASANVMVPLMIGLAQSAGLDPQRVALATCLACSLGFMLPISTPPNAIAYGTGLVRIPVMMRRGLLLDVFGGCAVWVIARWLL